MGYNDVCACITTINDDSIKIDDSKFPMFPLPVIGEEFCDTELGTLICAVEHE